MSLGCSVCVCLCVSIQSDLLCHLCLQENIQCILIESIWKRVSGGLKMLTKAESRRGEEERVEEERSYLDIRIFLIER